MKVQLTPSSSSTEQLVPTVKCNYMARLNRVVANGMRQATDFSQMDKKESANLKREIKKLAKDSADWTRSSGNFGIGFAVLGLASSVCYLSPHKSDHQIGGLFGSTFCPKLGEWQGARLNAKIREADSLSQLSQSEFSAKSTKGQNDTSKQELKDILDKAYDSIRAAARS